MTTDPNTSPAQVEPLAVGAVRITIPNLQADERQHGTLVRDLDPTAARRMAADLLQAAEDADRMRATLQP